MSNLFAWFTMMKRRSQLSNSGLLLMLVLLVSACSDSEQQSEAVFTPMQTIGFAAWESTKVLPPETSHKITLVDFWATWCDSCLREFPKIVALHEKFVTSGLRVVSLNLDEWEDKSTTARANDFLRSKNAMFEHYQLQENMLGAFEYFNLLGIPAIVLYDKDGKELERFTGDDPENQYTIEMIESAVAKYTAI